MDILHISDLHVTPGFESLKDVWTGPSSALGGQKFDFVVVSGDLSQRASSDEYAKLREFAESKLEPLLRSREKPRIIFVPGNHDVQWGADITEAVRLAAYRTTDEIDRFREAEKKYRRSPRESDLRFASTQYGHFEWLRLKSPTEYQKRFANAQRFLDDYYGSSLKTSPHRVFDLLHHEDGKDWSCHVFPNEGVAFFGFNSCDRNDEFWRGAHINRESLAAAQAHGNDLKSRHGDILLVAVWHHGLAADQGSPDYLNVSDIGYLSNCGFHVGFHGHTHRATNQVVDLLRHRIAVLSTGSLAAGASERPDAVGNQFSIAKLYRGKARIDVYQRDGNTREYTRQPSRFFQFGQIERNQEPSGWGKKHIRSWTVSEVGIVRGEVSLEGCDLRDAGSLAQISPPYCNVSGDESAWVTVDGYQNRASVRKISLPDGRISFTVDSNSGPHVGLAWGYHLSNAVALTGVELDEFFSDRATHFPHLAQGWDARVHTVRFNCEQLRITLKFDGGTRLAEAEPVAEEVVVEKGEQHWRAIPRHRMDCRLDFDRGTPTSATLTVDAPTIGSRYGIKYKPQTRGNEYPQDARDLGQRILESCRGTPSSSDNSLSSDFTNRVRLAILKQMRPEAKDNDLLLDGDGSWTGFVWHPGRRRLLVAFGEFPPESWSARFAAGAGVAGHCFRFSNVAAWHKDSKRASSVIYQEHTEHHQVYSRKYAWILCVPLRLNRDGPAIGVLGFAGERASSATTLRFEALAKAICSEQLRDAQREELSKLETAALVAFWTTLDECTLPGIAIHREYIRTTLRKFAPA